MFYFFFFEKGKKTTVLLLLIRFWGCLAVDPMTVGVANEEFNSVTSRCPVAAQQA